MSTHKKMLQTVEAMKYLKKARKITFVLKCFQIQICLRVSTGKLYLDIQLLFCKSFLHNRSGEGKHQSSLLNPKYKFNGRIINITLLNKQSGDLLLSLEQFLEHLEFILNSVDTDCSNLSIHKHIHELDVFHLEMAIHCLS